MQALCRVQHKLSFPDFGQTRVRHIRMMSGLFCVKRNFKLDTSCVKRVLLKQEKIRASEGFSSQNSTESNLKLHEFRSAFHNALHLQDQTSLYLKPFRVSREISRLKPLARVRHLF